MAYTHQINVTNNYPYYSTTTMLFGPALRDNHHIVEMNSMKSIC